MPSSLCFLTGRCRLSLGVLAILLGNAPWAPAQFQDLATKIPASANTLALLDAERILSSPLAIKENWKGSYEQAFASGLVHIPPTTRRMVIAQQLDIEVKQPVWEVGVVQLAGDASLATVARDRKGAVDNIGGLQAVALREDSYLVQFGQRLLGAMSPANRQAVSRWVRDSQARTKPELSPFLAQVLANSELDAIVQAFDLQDAVPLDVIRTKVAESETLKSKAAEHEQLAQLLATIKGVMLEVRVTEVAAGRITVEFGQDASPLADLAKPLLLEVLADNGMYVNDLETWKPQMAGTKFTLTGPLTKSGMRRALSMIDHPLQALTAAAPPLPPDDSQKLSVQAAATQKYFTAVSSLLDDLRQEVKRPDARTLSQIALWIDNWARKIDRLPILNVDPEMLQYRSSVTSDLRSAATALRGVGIVGGARAAQITPEVSGSIQSGISPYGYWGPYAGYGRYGYTSGYFEWRDVNAERRKVKSEEKAKGALNARAYVTKIQEETDAIRTKMSQKYQINF